ncbi:MAG TPA: HEAT repeat domain-containing protein [Planctomycetaceae bacterium]|nr:HEAT repeat domain-containing protein [Planctomycetaceae bacterium]
MAQSHEAEISRLVEELHEPETRRRARRKLVALKAVAPLLECLQSDNESVVWAAVESLGQLRAQEAVRPLVELLARGVLVLDVSEALARITGQNLGADVQRWKAWLAGPSEARARGVELQQCVRQAAQHLGAEALGSGDRFDLTVPVGEGRRQRVQVYLGRHDPQGEELVVIYSRCGPAQPRLYESALRKNMRLAAGAFAIRDIDGQPQFVMVDTMIAATATPTALARKIEQMAAQSDAAEQALVKEDRY